MGLCRDVEDLGFGKDVEDMKFEVQWGLKLICGTLIVSHPDLTATATTLAPHPPSAPPTWTPARSRATKMG